MKRIVSLFLIISIFLSAGCAKQAPAEETTAETAVSETEAATTAPHADEKEPLPEINADELFAQYLANVDKNKTPQREVGQPVSHVHMDEKLIIGILYPDTDIAELDSAIKSYMDDLAKEYLGEVSANKGGDFPAELYLSYDSYKIGKSMVSVKLSGSFIAPYLAHPVDVVKTFIADAKSGKIKETASILAKGDGFKNKVIKDAGINAADVDEHILDNAVLRSDGIEITFTQGDYFPMSDGTKVLFFKYEDIADHLADSFELKPKKKDPPKVETQAPETEKKPEPVKPKPKPVKPKPKPEPVKPLPKPNITRPIDPTKPMIALTFDDGPSAHTDRLLDIFKKYGGKGTFFVVGNLIDKRPNTVKRIVAEGHDIGGHSWDHKKLTTLNEKALTDQIVKTRTKIKSITGVDTYLVRPPYGAHNEYVRGVAAKLGVPFINWSVDTVDWKTKNAQAVYNEIMKSTKNGSIILCHDLHKTTVDAMETVIPKLIADGYQLVTVSELLSYSNNGLVPGNVYYKK